jgi:hypothetical protein
MQAIEHCRTPALGGHVYYCPRCEKTQYRYHSCKNRHCPKCQQDTAQEWLVQQQRCLLRVPHFMLTFTLPAQLRRIARSHQKALYSLLFRASAAATQQLARDPRLLGGHIGLMGVLQTWARDLSYHPHVHYLVPGGALSPDGQTWLSARKRFFLPVRPLGVLFRAKFRDGLRKTDWFESIPSSVWRQAWVVNCQPVGNGLPALRYLARYVFRVALTSQRIQRVENDQVTFSYRDGDSGATRLCTLSAEEFIRRFLQHILPKGWVKVRYYGLFSPGQRQRLDLVRERLGGSQDPGCCPTPGVRDSQAQVASVPCASHAPARCPFCGEVLQWRYALQPGGPGPPRS